MSGQDRRTRTLDVERAKTANRRLTSEDVARAAGVSLSVDQPIEHMAQAAVDMMALRIEDTHLPAERRLFPGRLQRGQSVAV